MAMVALDVLIGVVLVFLLLSLACSAAAELLASITNLRAAGLERGLAALVPGRERDVKAHPLVAGITGAERPSYIPKRAFALALLETLRSDKVPSALTDPQGFIDRLPEVEPLRKVLRPLFEKAGYETQAALANIEAWYDDAMQRVSGWYKRSSRIIVLAIAGVGAVGLNVDAVNLVRVLSTNAAVRDALVAQAQATASAEVMRARPASVDEAGGRLAALRNTGIPLGWSAAPLDKDVRGIPGDALGWLAKLLGLGITTLAASIGAPFWFDLLNRLVNIRSSIHPDEPRRRRGAETTKS